MTIGKKWWNEKASGKSRIKYGDSGNLMEITTYDLVSQYDKVLHTPAREIDFTEISHVDLVELAHSMVEVCEKHHGMGLSAPQIGIPLRLSIVNMVEENQYWIFVNPKIISVGEIGESVREGCLSYPGLFLTIKRPQTVTVESQDLAGNIQQRELSGLGAVVLLHEIDHLDGITFTDKVSKVKLQREKEKIKKNLKNQKRYLENMKRLAMEAAKNQPETIKTPEKEELMLKVNR